ncbi:MAG: EamA family transporter [Candidatus Limnocylindrales bacterium]|jgi:inner membrane transporter RhtA
MASADASGTGAVSDPGRLDAVPPELLILIGSLSVQCGGGLATVLVRDYGPLPSVSMRIVFGAIMLLALRPARIRGASRSALLSCLALGFVLAAMNSLFFVALSRIPIGVAVTIEFWGPLAVAVLGSRRALDLVWVALAAAGIYVLAGGRLEADDAVGVIAAAASGLCWAIYIGVAGQVVRHWPDGRGLTLAMLVATALILPVTLTLSDVRPLLVAPAALAGGAVIGLFNSAIPYTTELAALRRMKASTFGVLMSLEPAIATGVGFIMLGQVLSASELAAIACVALASAGASVSARRLVTAPGALESA